MYAYKYTCTHRQTDTQARIHNLTEFSFTLYTAPNAPFPSCCFLSSTSLALTLVNEVISSNIYIHNVCTCNIIILCIQVKFTSLVYNVRQVKSSVKHVITDSIKTTELHVSLQGKI